MSTKKKVAYFYDSEVGQFYYGQGHPMKPHRIRMAHSLILHYGLYNMMQVYRPHPASAEDMMRFHTEDYVNFLRNVSPDNMDEYEEHLKTFNVGEDCPVFDGLYRYCQLYAGGSVGGAVKLNYGTSDVVINWAGGLHHAKKSEASGFCYVNDIVLAILELLKYNARVLYIDIDIHHGDGVEEAFLTTDRVMTVSFHKFGDNFFPGTGDLVNQGHGPGRGYSVNAPLRDGMDDGAYEQLFKPVMAKIMEVYQPQAIVFQSGADSLTGDRLGCFNLSIRGHAECIKYMQSFNVPMLLLGGGGYKISNVARCWAYETGAILGVDMAEKLPPNEYYEFYGPDYRLHLRPRADQPNDNSAGYLASLRDYLLAQISRLAPAPGVGFHERAPDAMREEDMLPASPTQENQEHAEERSRMLWQRREDESGSGRVREDHSYAGNNSVSTSGPPQPPGAANGSAGPAPQAEANGAGGSLQAEPRSQPAPPHQQHAAAAGPGQPWQQQQQQPPPATQPAGQQQAAGPAAAGHRALPLVGLRDAIVGAFENFRPKQEGST